MSSSAVKTYFIIRPKLRRFTLLMCIIFFVGLIATALTYPDNPLYIPIMALTAIVLIFLIHRVISLSLYTYKITDTYVESSRDFLIWDDMHRVPITKIQSYEVHAGILNKLTGTTTLIFKHGSTDKPSIVLRYVGIEYVDSVENAIELIIRRDIKGPDSK